MLGFMFFSLSLNVELILIFDVLMCVFVFLMVQ